MDRDNTQEQIEITEGNDQPQERRAETDGPTPDWGERLKEWRQRLVLTQQEVADRIGLGVSSSLIGRLERGFPISSKHRADRIFEVTGVRPGYKRKSRRSGEQMKDSDDRIEIAMRKLGPSTAAQIATESGVNLDLLRTRLLRYLNTGIAVDRKLATSARGKCYLWWRTDGPNQPEGRDEICPCGGGRRGGDDMTPSLIVDEVKAQGVQIWRVGDSLKLRPASVLSNELRSLLLTHKPALLAYLTEKGLTVAPPLEEEKETSVQATPPLSHKKQDLEAENTRLKDLLRRAEIEREEAEQLERENEAIREKLRSLGVEV